jgi:hypothetical protein
MGCDCRGRRRAVMHNDKDDEVLFRRVKTASMGKVWRVDYKSSLSETWKCFVIDCAFDHVMIPITLAVAHSML